jgi:hypothetical protein
MPMMATTIISSMSVKPRWLPSIFLCQKLNMSCVPLVWFVVWPPQRLPRSGVCLWFR